MKTKTACLLFTIFSLLIFRSEAALLNSISPAGEVDIGREADKDILKVYGYYNKKELQAYVDEI